MSSEYERLTIGGLQLYGTDYLLEAFSYTPPKRIPKLVSNADADGDLLVRESHFTDSSFVLTVRVEPQETMAAALEKLAAITDALAQTEREEGGLSLLWIPAGTETEYTAYVKTADFEEIPIEISGESAGYFINAPRVRITLTAGFLETAERVVKTATESGAEPLQTLYVGGIKGDVPAKARILITDTASQPRHFAEIGQEVREDEKGPGLLLKGITNLSVTGYAGESSTRTNSYSTNVVKATARTVIQTLCSSGSIAHIGSYRLKLRVQVETGENEPAFRASFRTGDGEWTALPWATLTASAQWWELDLGEAFFEEVSSGEQVSEIVIEAATAEGKSVCWVDFLDLEPAHRFTNLQTPGTLPIPKALTAYSDASTESGGINGDSLPIGGGKWECAGDAVDFTKEGETFKRSEHNDASNAGRYAVISNTKMTDQVVRVTVEADNASFTYGQKLGVLARYVSTESWLEAYLEVRRGYAYLKVRKRVSGTVTELGTATVMGVEEFLNTTVDIYLAVSSAGYWTAWVGSGLRPPELYLAGSDSVLAAEGTLAEGKAGIFDECNAEVSVSNRYYSHPAVWPFADSPVCLSGKTLEVASTGSRRQNSGEKYWSPLPMQRGANIYLDPAGESSRVNRLAIKMRRINSLEGSNATVKDKQKVEVKVTERFLFPR